MNLRLAPLLLAGIAAASSASAYGAGEAVATGIVDDPCAQVPLRQTAAHQASADPYGSWMHDWLSMDWGQLCRYRADNRALAPRADRVVMLGDSITEGWIQAQPGFFSDRVLDRGISGQTTAQMLVRLRVDVLDLKPRIVHVMAGTNDIAGNTGPTSLEILQGNLRSIVEQSRAHGIRVVLASIPPATQFWWNKPLQPRDSIAAMNRWLADYAKREHLVYVDYHTALSEPDGSFKATLSDDGVHPNAAGYAVMRPLAEAALRRAASAR